MAAVSVHPAQSVYPSGALVGCETALVLFCAAFGGVQDCWFIAEAGLTATCVDEDAEKLAEMGPYPDGWEFVCEDVFQFVSGSERQWDVVSADPFTHDFERCAAILPELCRLARHAVIIGVAPGTVLDPPPGWAETGRVFRSSYNTGVYWATVERV
jgi:hypothetical protein